jgi:hypothetical protein
MKMTFDGDDEDDLVCTRTFLCRKHAPVQARALVAPNLARPKARLADERTGKKSAARPAAELDTPRIKKALVRPSKLLALESDLNFDNCAVCGLDESVEHNYIVYCDKCNVGVHQMVCRPVKIIAIVAF